MLSYIWPLALVVAANTLYQISAKSVPADLDPLASITISYLIAAAVSFILYFVLRKGGTLAEEYSKLNWAPFAIGVILIGLDVGCIYAYKVGWPVSTMQIVQAAVLAILLIFVGRMLYKEELTWNKLVGVAVCLVGLGLINYK